MENCERKGRARAGPVSGRAHGKLFGGGLGWGPNGWPVSAARAAVWCVPRWPVELLQRRCGARRDVSQGDGVLAVGLDVVGVEVGGHAGTGRC